MSLAMSWTSVELDEIDGAQASHHIINGWAITRCATVVGLTPLDSGAYVTTGMLFEAAEQALIADPDVGDRGSPCPDIPVGTYLEQFVPEAISGKDVKVRIIYKGYPLSVYEFETSLGQIESNLDAFGNPITLQYQYPSNYPYNTSYQGQTKTVSQVVSRQMSEGSLTLKFLLVGPTAFNDLAYLMTLEGCINEESYGVGSFSGGPHTWMCTRVRGVTKDGGFSYEVNITFQLRYTTWDQYMVYIDPNTGLPPADLVPGTGTKTIQVYQAVPFPTFVFSGN